MSKVVSYDDTPKVKPGQKYWMGAINGPAEFYVYNTTEPNARGRVLINHLAHTSQAVIWGSPSRLDPHKWKVRFSTKKHRKVNTKATFPSKTAAKKFIEDAFKGE